MSEDPGILGSETQVIDTRILSQASFFLIRTRKSLEIYNLTT